MANRIHLAHRGNQNRGAERNHETQRVDHVYHRLRKGSGIVHAGGCQPGLNPKCQESNLIPLLRTLHVCGSAMALTTHGESFAAKITCHGPLALPGEELGDRQWHPRRGP